MNEIEIEDPVNSCESGRWRSVSDAVDALKKTRNISEIKVMVENVIMNGDSSRAIILSQALAGRVDSERYKMLEMSDEQEKATIMKYIDQINRLIMELINMAAKVF